MKSRNTEKVFKSLKDVAEHIGCSKSSIHLSIRKNRPLLKKFKIDILELKLVGIENTVILKE